MSKSIIFSTVKQEDIDASNIVIESGSGIINNVKSLALGSISFIQPCSTCSLTDLCYGHPGKQSLSYPLFKVIFKKYLEEICESMCPTCGFIKNPLIKKLLDSIEKNNNIITSEDRAIFKKIISESNFNKQTKTKCTNVFCDTPTSTSIQYNNGYFIYNTDNTQYICDTEKIYNFIASLPKNYLALLTPNSSIVRPTDFFFVNNLYIPPNSIREPNIHEDISFDQTTSDLNNLSKIIANADVKDFKKAQIYLDNMIISQKAKPYNKIKKETISIRAHGKAKECIAVKQIYGKRIDGTGRAVAGPGINLRIGNILVPDLIKKNLTEYIYFNRITEKKILTELRNPSMDPTEKLLTYIKVDPFNNRPYKIINLKDSYKLISPKYGDIFEIMKNSGLATVTRAPSIHHYNFISVSIEMPNYVKNEIQRTINISECVAPSKNLDFDGDELTIAVFNNPAANVELSSVMNSKKLLKHPQTGTTMYGLVQDQIVSSNLFLQEECITLDRAYLYFGEYSFLLLNNPKNIYTGRELMSLIFPKNFSLENVFENGTIISDIIKTNMVSANSYNSIFNGLSQYYGDNYVVTLIDTFKSIIQKYNEFLGLSIKMTDFVPFPELIDTISLLVEEQVSKIDYKIDQLKKDILNGRTWISSYHDISNLKEKNIKILDKNINIKDILEKYYKPIKNNNYYTCYKMEYKLSNEDATGMIIRGGQKKNTIFPTPTINGKTSLFGIANDIKLSSSGFVKNSYIKGVTFNEQIMMIKEESLPQIISVTADTSEVGAMGRKLVKIMSELHINNDRFMVSNEYIINFNPNCLKISVADMSKAKLVFPNEKFIWNKHISKLFDEKIKDYIIQKNFNNEYIILEKVDFYINIHSEIVTYYYNALDNKKKFIIDTDKNYKKINQFFEIINKRFYFNLNDISYVLYILLTHLDPSGLIYKNNNRKDINKYLSEELIENIFEKIIYKLIYSLSSGTMFGYQIANTIQEKNTQQTLSAFHTTTKAGSNVQKNSSKQFKHLLEWAIKDVEGIVTCTAYDASVLEKIKYQFDYISLKIICDSIEIIKEDEINKTCLYQLDISSIIMIQKNLDINILYRMIKKYCDNCFSLHEYSIYIKLEDKYIKIFLYVQFKTYHKNLQISFNLLKYYFKTSLWDGVHKGKQININLYIEELTSKLLDDNYTIIEKPLYQLMFFVETINDLSIINTSKLENLYTPAKYSYHAGGIHFAKLNNMGKGINIIKDNDFIHPIKHLVDFRCALVKPLNIKTLYNPKEIMKKANHGDNNSFVKAAVNNEIDKCQCVYSSIFASTVPKIGTNYHDFYINANLYDKYKKKNIEEDIFDKDVKIISVI